jgi:hypothetical protein
MEIKEGEFAGRKQKESQHTIANLELLSLQSGMGAQWLLSKAPAVQTGFAGEDRERDRMSKEGLGERD